MVLKKHGSLLRLAFYDYPQTQSIISWSTITDFAVIQVLEFGNILRVDPFDYMAANCDFVSLKTLVIRCDDSHFPYRLGDSDDKQEALAVDNAVACFLLSLPPLQALELSGDFGQTTFEAMLAHHGKSLKRLHLMPSQRYGQFGLSLKELEQTTRCCPMVNELAIKIRRSLGDDLEMASYKLLGTLSRLQSLHLVLDASKCALGSEEINNGYEPGEPGHEYIVPNDSRFDKKDQEILPDIRLRPLNIGIRRGFVRDAFINWALDESLARSIFKTVSSGKTPGAPLLEKMHIFVEGAFVFSNYNIFESAFREVAEHMRQSWLVQRNSRDDCRDEVLVTSLVPKHKVNPYVSSLGYSEHREIFESIWPEDTTGSRGDTDWRDNWHSFPLQS
jgi:hypothetical protein